ncbi:MAG: SCP2 sterol-binding domain-containing protein [Betaproteobacteria bacterium]|nr:SCP2 sterol-binding domain-containing protein [Betaproteobacteria bacterium]
MGKAKEALKEAVPRMNANPKAREIIQVLPRVIAFDLEGEGEPFALAVKDDDTVCLSDETRDSEIVVSGNAAEFAKIINREGEVTHAVAEGKIWVSKGKLSRMILLDRLLNLSRKR